jgi:hypothetical protein
LFVLVILHDFFYGALLRITSSFTLLLGPRFITVFVGQAGGVPALAAACRPCPASDPPLYS